MLNNQLWNLRQEVNNTGIAPKLEAFEFIELLDAYENNEISEITVYDLKRDVEDYEKQIGKADKAIIKAFDNSEKSFAKIKTSLDGIDLRIEQAKELVVTNELPQEFIEVFDELLDKIYAATVDIQDNNDDILSEIKDLKGFF